MAFFFSEKNVPLQRFFNQTMKPLLTFAAFLLCFLLKAQIPHGIELPANVGNPDTIETDSVAYYITENQEVFDANGKQFIFFDDISNHFLNATQEITIIYTPLIFADKNTPFAFVEKVIQQIVSARGHRICYMTQRHDGRGYLYLNASTLYRKDLDEIAHFQPKIEEEETSEENEMENFSPPPPPPLPWYLSIRSMMYSNDLEEVSSVLKENQYAIITILPEQKIAFNGAEIGREKLTELLVNHRVLFLRFGKNLRYNDYIQTLNTIYEIGKKSHYNVAYPIELFSDLEAFLKENNIKL